MRRGFLNRSLPISVALSACVLAAGPGMAWGGRVVVATDGSGDFTSVGAALDSIAPTESNPYVIEVMPGRYVGAVRMKSHVHLRGSGAHTTTLEGTALASHVIGLVDVHHVTISGLTVRLGQRAGIRIVRSVNVAVKDSVVSGNPGFGLYASASVVDLEDNEIRENGADGIVLVGEVLSSSEALSKVTNNRILLNGGNGIRLVSYDAFVTNNRILFNRRDGMGFYKGARVIAMGNHVAQNDRYGAYITTYAQVRLTHNHLYDNTAVNSSSPRADIYIDDANIGAWPPMISYNVYDRLIGTGGHGAYNTNINGAALPNP